MCWLGQKDEIEKRANGRSRVFAWAASECDALAWAQTRRMILRRGKMAARV
jgi:hypothetical protein